MIALTPQQVQLLDTADATFQIVAPTFGPNGLLLATIVAGAHALLKSASNAGENITDEQLAALFGKFDVNRADDLAAQADALAAAAAAASVPKQPDPWIRNDSKVDQAVDPHDPHDPHVPPVTP